MHDGLHRGDTSNMEMEQVERRKTPAGRPEKDVIASGKDPEEREVCKGEDSGAVGHIAKDLFINRGPAARGQKIGTESI